MIVGCIFPISLPFHGGAEQYEYRLAKGLEYLGHDVHVLSGLAEDPLKENGTWNITRKSEGYTPVTWLSLTAESNHLSNLESILGNHEFIEFALTWLEQIQPDLVILGSGFNISTAFYVRELIFAIKATGIPIGMTHHDTGDFIDKLINQKFKSSSFRWDDLVDAVTDYLRAENLENPGELSKLFAIQSPTCLRTDFIITNSFWSAKLADPYKLCSPFVLHPLMFSKHFGGSKPISEVQTNHFRLSDVLMINPQGRKNPELMAYVINNCPELSFRLLRGGWGNSFETFLPLIKKSKAFESGNIELVDYAADMHQVYRNTRLLFFPSFVEGYGMAAVEPMLHSVPVVSSNYPPIVEATGDGAFSLCPYRDSPRRWVDGIYEVLDHASYWGNQAGIRALELYERERKEIQDLNLWLVDQL